MIELKYTITVKCKSGRRQSALKPLGNSRGKSSYKLYTLLRLLIVYWVIPGRTEIECITFKVGKGENKIIPTSQQV